MLENRRNWAGNYTYSTDRVYEARSVEEVCDYVRQHDRLKVLGTRHCFNNIADSHHNFLSIAPMNKIVELDAAAGTVTVEGAMRYGDLCPWLEERGFALHNLASLPHISIAGACATATHGSGIKNGNLATAVAAMEVVTANGEIQTFERGSLLPVVHLGAIGVVTKITLDIQPTYQMRQDVYLNLPMSQLCDHFMAIVSSGYSVSLFTDWKDNSINAIWIKRRMDEPSANQTVPEFYGATRATRNVHPIPDLSAENCTEQMGVPGPWHERLPHFRMGFTPSSGDELQTEYFVPIQHAVEAMLAIERLRERIAPHLQISEVRTIDADDLGMSPCRQRRSLAIHFTWKPDWPSVRKLLPVIEKELNLFEARPHWGKLFTTAPETLKAVYGGELMQFKTLTNSLDREGKFRNEYLNRILLS